MGIRIKEVLEIVEEIRSVEVDELKSNGGEDAGGVGVNGAVREGVEGNGAVG